MFTAELIVFKPKIGAARATLPVFLKKTINNLHTFFTQIIYLWIITTTILLLFIILLHIHANLYTYENN